MASVTGLSCIEDPTELMMERVLREPILDMAPAGATPQSAGSMEPACLDDDIIGEVQRPYSFHGSPRDVLAFYTAKATADGWRMTRDGLGKLNPRAGSDELWPSDTCFAKDLGGFVADLQIAFDYWSPKVTSRPEVQTYWRSITFSTTGGDCANNINLY
ncbi:hypothetical protein [Herbidospora mongoliensis]|uniref:hypothetical protein n=1 Tax=Herbidospora mongoliensis TaxID=688067 RepID=UPI0012F70BCF|nr:hypothetical protein [Herbidospora mongoliensis]